jgi:hypothetical protein
MGDTVVRSNGIAATLLMVAQRLEKLTKSWSRRMD